jgi:hypothetical protein
LPEHGVNQRGLAVIHVGNDGDVANTWIQIKNSSGLQIGAYYYFTMRERFRRVAPASCRLSLSPARWVRPNPCLTRIVT